MSLIFLDTETTDLEPTRRLVQLAYKNPASGVVVNEYFKPPMPISYGAMAIHHVTNEMVADKPVFGGSEVFNQLVQEIPSIVVVAHNAPFDIEVLKNEGVMVARAIDTLRLARHVIEAEQYNLQFLRYFLGLNITGVNAHDALGDILVLEALYNHLEKVVAEKFGVEGESAVEKMIELTNTPVLLKSFGFGKYRGKSFEEVAASDHGYLDWLFGSESAKNPAEQNEDLMVTLKHYCGK